jgi:hypothetical protein
MRTSLKGIIAAVCLATSSLFFPIQNFAEKKIVFNETYPVPMIYEDGKKAEEEKINIQASIDNETNSISLGVYTQDYNRKNWRGNRKESLPLSEQYTRINHTYSKIFILRPSRIKIENQEQKIYTVPQHEWYSELQPYEKDQRSQLLIETGIRTIDKILSKIPFLNRSYDKYLEDAKQKETEYYDNLFESIEPDYVRTKISPYIPKKLIGCTETAREYDIQFDIGNTQDEIPVYAWLRIDLGDSSIAGQGCFPNRYGKLENILIKFTLNEENIKRDDLYFYFLHGDELKSINVSKDNIEGTSSNPAIITVSNMGYEERKSYEEDKVVRIGIAEYIIQESGDSSEKDLSWGVVQFESAESREDFMKRREEDLKYPLFVKDSVLSYIEEPTIEEVTSPLKDFSEEQYIIYGDLIVDYSSRTGMEIILNKNPTRSKSLLKQIENYKEGR